MSWVLIAGMWGGLESAPILAQVPIEWAAPVDGIFSEAANWSPMVVPGAGDTAVLGGVGPYAVRFNVSRTITTLDIANPQVVAGLDSERSLTVDELLGSGEFLVNRTRTAREASLRIVPGGLVASRVRLNQLPGVGTIDASLIGPSAPDAATITGEIVGTGTIFGHFHNDGLIMPEGMDARIVISNGGITQGDDGVLSARDGRSVRISNSTVEGGRLQGGDLDAPGFLEGVAGTIRDATIEGSWQVAERGRIWLAGSIAGTGSLGIARPDSTSASDVQLADAASINIHLQLGRLVFSRVERLGENDAPAIGLDGTISGSGELVGHYVIAGTLTPGITDAGAGAIGELRTHPVGLDPNTLMLTSTAQVNVDIVGTSDDQFDRISRLGTMTLGGTLDIDFIDGFVPEPRDQFEVISVTAIEGSFADIDIEPVGAIGPAHVVYTDTSVIVVVCAADRDADGELTIFDFLAFQNLFDSGDLRADLDEDGLLTIFDFLVFQNRFDTGCG